MAQVGQNGEVGRNILEPLCASFEVAVEIGKHLNPADVVTLYSTCRAFRTAIDNYMSASVHAWIAHKAPEAGAVFDSRFYKRHLVSDPAGRTWAYQYNTSEASKATPGGELPSPPPPPVDAGPLIEYTKSKEVREIPGLKYLQLVVGRDRYCREIRAILARNGHRTPASMHLTLLKLWLCLDIPTSAQRAAILRNMTVWSDIDLYNAQLLFVKLGMHFNDPIYGPNTYELLHLMMGQKGLYPLWQLLMRRRFTRLGEILTLKVRYDFPKASSPVDGGAPGDDTQQHWSQEYFGSSIHGVPYHEIGRGHLEGWGQGQRHLLRPDELVPIEAVTRGLELDMHLTAMMLWGYMDWQTGANLVPSEEEMYISDEEQALAHADTSHHWRRRHVLKKRFAELDPADRRRIYEEDEDERLRAMAWCGDDADDCSSGDDSSDNERYTLDDEMERGYIVPPRQWRGEGGEHPEVVVVPEADDDEGWVGFVNDVVMSGLPPDVGAEEALRAQAWQSYQDSETTGGWDWAQWLRQHEAERDLAGVASDDDDDDDDDDDGVGDDGSASDSDESTVTGGDDGEFTV